MDSNSSLCNIASSLKHCDFPNLYMQYLVCTYEWRICLDFLYQCSMQNLNWLHFWFILDLSLHRMICCTDQFYWWCNALLSCVICCTAYKNRDSLITLPCVHRYHKDCIEPWLVRNKVNCLFYFLRSPGWLFLSCFSYYGLGDLCCETLCKHFTFNNK